MTAQAANAEREGSEGTSESHGSSPSKAAEPKGSAKNFTFLTITDPKQARDKKNKKSVRSHVMFDFAARQKQSDSGVKPGRRKSAKSRQKSTSDIASSEFAYDEDSPRLGAWPLTDAVMHGLSDVRDLAQSLTLRRRSSAAGDTTGAMPNNQDISRYYRALMTLNKLGGKDAKPQEVLNQDDETFEVVWKAGFVKPYMIQGLGDEIDPFFVLPQFRNPMIYMAELKMWCK